jgi:trimeric autotransporter adhesin
MMLVSLLSMEAGASSWFLGTQVRSSGGRMDSPNKAGQGVADGIIYRSYTTYAPLRVTVAADPGFSIRTVVSGGTTFNAPLSSPFVATVDGSAGDTRVTATFLPAQLSVTATNPGGTVTPASIGNVVYGHRLSGPVTFRFIPAQGREIVGIDGVPPDPAVSHSSYSPGINKPVTVTLPSGYLFTSAVNLRAVVENKTPSINAILPRTVTTGARVTLTAVASNVPSPSFTWSYVSGPANTAVIKRDSKGKLVGSIVAPGPPLSDLTGTDSAAVSFTAPAVPGQYKFQVMAPLQGGRNLTTLATVNVYASASLAAKNQCLFCHKAIGIGDKAIYANWSSSGHNRSGIVCAKCHVGTDSGGHPGELTRGTVDRTTFAYRRLSGSFCLNGSCHAPGVTHNSLGMACVTCHNSEIHSPDTSFSAAVNNCFTCHGAPNSAHYLVKTSLSASQCGACHNPSGHNPAPDPRVTRAHFNGYSSYVNPGYAAAYVTPRTACADCHKAGAPASADDAALKNFRSDWAASGHGDTSSLAWKSSASHDWKSTGAPGATAATGSGANDCVRCHSASGFQRFLQDGSVAPVGDRADHSSEPLACSACHDPDFGVKKLPPVTAYYNYSSAATGKLVAGRTFADYGKSNVCLSCHAGRTGAGTFQAIKAQTVLQPYSSSFWRNLPYLDGHYLASGGVLGGVAGYQYPGQQYGSGSAGHGAVAASSGEGPCVGCHMQESSHRYQAVAGQICETCHGSGNMTAETVAARKSAFAAALKALQAALILKGYPPLLDGNGAFAYPYFKASNWGDGATGPGNMGAAHNFSVLSHDPGAFAHNPTYAKRLIRDSIDWLYNGSVDRSRDIAPAVAALLPVTEGSDANGFLSGCAGVSSSCSSCHAGSKDLAGNAIVATYAASLHGTDPKGPGCASCHAPSPEVAHPPATMLTGTSEVSAKCSGCHPSHSWNSAGICTTCHNGHNPKVAMPFPHYSNYSSAHYITPPFTCENCHNETDENGATTFQVYSASRQWARSGKGNPYSPSYMSYDFKRLGSDTPASENATGNDCVRCHTMTGYLNYVDSNFQDIRAWGTPGDQTKEMISCPTCHTTPFIPYDTYQKVPSSEYSWLDYDIYHPAYGRRLVPPLQAYDELYLNSNAVPPVVAYYNYSAPGYRKVLKSVKLPTSSMDSNSCLVCHSGRRSGQNLKDLNGDFPSLKQYNPYWSDAPFIEPHGGAAGIFSVVSGYNYSHFRRQYSIFFGHQFGEDYNGPCVCCHMKGYDYKQPYKDHLFRAISSASNGDIAKINAYQDLCYYCHDGRRDLSPAQLTGYRKQFASALKALGAVLAGKGIYFNPSLPPYFFNVGDKAQQGPPATQYRNWNANYSQGSYFGVDMMGAAFNLRLLSSDPGAYVHQNNYNRMLIYDSIDLVDNGIMDSSVAVTIQNLQLSPDFTQEDKSNALIAVGIRPTQ